VGTEREPKPSSDVVRSASADLLDLVRSAEDEALLSLRKRTPAVAMSAPGRGQPEFVDVDDEAIDAPSTPPPIPAAGARTELHGVASREEAAARAHAVEPRGWPPAIGIAVLLGIVIGALALVAR
jgi:hypothetical protein